MAFCVILLADKSLELQLPGDNVRTIICILREDVVTESGGDEKG